MSEVLTSPLPQPGPLASMDSASEQIQNLQGEIMFGQNECQQADGVEKGPQPQMEELPCCTDEATQPLPSVEAEQGKPSYWPSDLPKDEQKYYYCVKISDYKSKFELFQKIWGHLLQLYKDDLAASNILIGCKPAYSQAYLEKLDWSKDIAEFTRLDFMKIQQSLEQELAWQSEEAQNAQIQHSINEKKMQLRANQAQTTDFLQLHEKEFEEIIPYELFHIGRLYQKSPDGLVKVDHILQRDQAYQPHYELHAKVYQHNLLVLNPERMPREVRLLYNVLNRQWAAAKKLSHQLFRCSSGTDCKLLELLSLTFASFQDMEEILNGSQKQVKDCFYRRTEEQYELEDPTMKEEAARIEAYLRNMSRCTAGMKGSKELMLALKLVRMMSCKMSEEQIQGICWTAGTQPLMRLMVARRFLNKEKYNNFVVNLKRQSLSQIKIESLIFLDLAADNFKPLKQCIRAETKRNPAHFERICLTCLVLLENYFEYNARQHIHHQERQIVQYLKRKVMLFQTGIEFHPHSKYNYEYTNKKRELIEESMQMKKRLQGGSTSLGFKYGVEDYQLKDYHRRDPDSNQQK